MGPEYLIDTNTAIDYLDNRLTVNANLLIEGTSCKISVITRMELLSWPGADETQTSVLERFIEGSTVYPLDEPVVIMAIAIRKTHKTKLPDAIIVATALINKLILVTRNIKDFHNIPDLILIDPHSL